MKKIRVQRAIYKALFILAIIMCILLCMPIVSEGAIQTVQPVMSPEPTATPDVVTITPEPIPMLMSVAEPVMQDTDEALLEKVAASREAAELTPREMFAELFPDENYDKTLDILAKVLHGESCGVYERSKTNCAAVIWCIGNRVDEGFRGDNFRECATAGSQFAYRKHAPVKQHLRDLAEDVLTRWLSEKFGDTDVGRVLPEGYCYFTGNGTYNVFREAYRGHADRITPKKSEVYD